MKRVKKKKINLIYKIISVLLILISIIFIGILLYLDLLPFKYFSIVAISIIVFALFNALLLNLKRLKTKVKSVVSIFSIIAILIMSIGSYFMSKTINVLANNNDAKYKLENYSIIVLKDSKYKDISDIKNEKIGYYENSVGSNDAKEYLSKKTSVKFDSYKDATSLITDLLNKDINVIMLEDSIKSVISEEISELDDKVKVIYTFDIKINVLSTLKDVDVTEEPFAVYISGIDTYGEISSVSRSDVNIVMLVNPKVHQVLLISIPRDYYVKLHGTTGYKDKLTHAGIYGIDMSIKTIEDLLDLDINYYLKVNFTSTIDIVNALGGLEVYSDYTFVSYSGYSFKKGYNKVNGEQALDFARTRKAFASGDRQRGKNQQALIEAMIRKATDKSIITKYSSLLDAVNGKYQTNMSMKKITSLIKKQLDSMKPWTITSYSLTGTDSTNYTYTYNQLLYVMEPDMNSINEAKSLIGKVLNNEALDSSYVSQSGSSNTVTKVKPPVETNETPKVVESSDKDEEDKNDDNKTTDDKESDKNNKDEENQKNENVTPKDPSIEDKNDENTTPDTGNKEENDNIEKPSTDEENNSDTDTEKSLRQS